MNVLCWISEAAEVMCKGGCYLTCDGKESCEMQVRLGTLSRLHNDQCRGGHVLKHNSEVYQDSIPVRPSCIVRYELLDSCSVLASSLVRLMLLFFLVQYDGQGRFVRKALDRWNGEAD